MSSLKSASRFTLYWEQFQLPGFIGQLVYQNCIIPPPYRILELVYQKLALTTTRSLSRKRAQTKCRQLERLWWRPQGEF